jgi:hypothetical protein
MKTDIIDQLFNKHSSPFVEAVEKKLDEKSGSQIEKEKQEIYKNGISRKSK